MDLKQALMSKNNITAEEAEQMIREMADDVIENDRDPEEVLDEEGLEPDYVFDLLDYC